MDARVARFWIWVVILGAAGIYWAAKSLPPEVAYAQDCRDILKSDQWKAVAGMTRDEICAEYGQEQARKAAQVR